MQADYQFSLVIISIAIAIFSACISLSNMDGVNVLPKRLKQLRIVSAGIAFATGVWTLHFVGMLAVKLPMPIAYSPSLFFLSYLFAIIGAIPAMALVSVEKKTTAHLSGVAVLLTLAVSSMHYCGMASMRMSPAIVYDPFWVGISLLIVFSAAYISLILTGNWSSDHKKNKGVFYSAGVFLGFGASAMHYLAMHATYFTVNSVSLAVTESGAFLGSNLVYIVISANLLVLILLLFSSLSVKNIILWKVLFIIGISELTIMLNLTAILPENTSKLVAGFLEVLLLILLVFPAAWQIKIKGQELLDSKKQIEKNLEAQQATNQLLSLPLQKLSMDAFLNKALKIILGTSWLKNLQQGAIFLNNPGENSLFMAADYHLPDSIKQQCNKVKHGECLCGLAASTLKIQDYSCVNEAHSIRFEKMQDHGHYNIPLISETVLHGVLCLYLPSGEHINDAKKSILQSFALTLAELITHKQAQEANQLAEAVFEHNLTSLIISDVDNKILYVNPDFTSVTGYTEVEAIGRTPAFLKSGRHDEKFYQNIWNSLNKKNRWEGELWNKRKNGEVYPQLSSITAVRGSDNKIRNYVASFTDITFKKEAEGRIKQLAYYDSLTGLPNRSLFYDRLKQAILQAKRDKAKMALLFIDLDRFKEVNDGFGHDAGDVLLKSVAMRVSSCVRATDTVARLGGDEFVVILRTLQGQKKQVMFNIEKIAANILAQCSMPFDYQSLVLNSGASVGIAIFPDDADNSRQLIQQADTAMYESKNAGRNKYSFFTAQMTERITQRNRMEKALHQALDANELSLVYQPLIDVDTQQRIGAEALLRWHSADLGFVSPLEFISVAEEMGLIRTIGEWVVKQACLQYKQWQESHVVNLNYIAVNVSMHQLISTDFAAKILRICETAGVATERIELEITEGGLAQYPETIMTVLHELRGLGFKLAIDDFGTDYSSLSRLKSFNVDLLKIDRSFISDLAKNNDDAAIVRAIIDMGAALGLTVLAEGVETVEQFELLKGYGCTRCQGYYFGKPVNAEKFAELWLGKK